MKKRRSPTAGGIGFAQRGAALGGTPSFYNRCVPHVDGLLDRLNARGELIGLRFAGGTQTSRANTL